MAKFDFWSPGGFVSQKWCHHHSFFVLTFDTFSIDTLCLSLVIHDLFEPSILTGIFNSNQVSKSFRQNDPQLFHCIFLMLRMHIFAPTCITGAILCDHVNSSWALVCSQEKSSTATKILKEHMCIRHVSHVLGDSPYNQFKLNLASLLRSWCKEYVNFHVNSYRAFYFVGG